MGIQDLLVLFLAKARDFVLPGIFALLWFIVGTILISFISASIKAKIIGNELEDDPYKEKISQIVGVLVKSIGQIFNVLIAFQIMGLNVGILMGGVSFGIGFAMQEILENMFAGFLIISNPMMRVGETVNLLGDLNVFGYIHKMHSRYTVIKLFTGRSLVVPNKILFETPLKTFKRENLIKGSVTFETGFSAPIEFVQKVMRDAINEYPYLVEKERTSVIVKAMNEWGVNYEVYYFFSPATGGVSGLRIKSDLRKIILKTMYKHDIKFLYQIQTIDFERGVMP